MNQENSPRVSIVIPTYNRAHLLPTCIQSCLDQTYDNIEVIVVDDGSTDNTAKIVAQFTKDDSRIIYFKKENGGLASALNYGFKFAKGTYLTWTSDDNYYDKEAISNMLMCLEQNNCSLVYSDYYRFNKNSPNLIREMRNPELDTLIQDNCLGPCFLYTRKVMEKIGEYDPETKLAEDYDYWIRVSKEFTICHLKKALYYYMDHEKSLSFKFKKNYEVQLVSILVKIKNNILDLQKATELFIKIILKKHLTAGFETRKAKNPFFALVLREKISYWWNKNWILKGILKALIKCKYYKKIFAILKTYKIKESNFIKAKLSIKNIIQ